MMAIALYSLVIVVLTLNFILAFLSSLYEGDLGSILFNSVRFAVYPFVGLGVSYLAIQSKRTIFVFSILVFLYEHVILKVVYVEILGKREELANAFNTLAMSFVERSRYAAEKYRHRV